MAFDFNYYNPTKVIFGREKELQVGELVKQFGGSRVLVHFGGQSAVKSGLIDRIKGALDAAGVFHVELGGVVPNPHISLVYKGIEMCKENQIDFILAVGGGSVIDSSKAIAYGLAYDGDVWDLFEHVAEATGSYPVGVILTIAAAGSETSDSCVITKAEDGRKRAYGNDISRPKFAIMNPELTMSLPDYQTMSGCTDIMMHTMERYFTNGGNMEITDEVAEGLLRCVMKNAEILHKDPMNYDARAEVMWSGSLSHNSLTGCGNDGGDFSSHMIEHELGGMFDVTHGAGLAAVWPSWARYCKDSCMSRFVKYAKNVMGVTMEGSDSDIAEEGIKRMEEFYHRIGMPTNLKELGIAPTDAQIRELAEETIKAAGGRQGSARSLDADDIVNILNMANK